MKLSEAMTKGDSQIAWTRGVFLDQRLSDGPWKGCALGAAAVGLYGLPANGNGVQIMKLQMRMEKEHPELHDREVLLEQGPQLPLRRAIMELNDCRGKTTREIAKWLKGQDL